MNLDFLGVEQNMTVLAGARSEYELDFRRGQDKVSMANVTFVGVVTAADGTTYSIGVQHTASGHVLLVSFPVLTEPGDYVYEIGYTTPEGARYRLLFGRLGVMCTQLMTERLEALQQGVRRLAVWLPEEAGGRMELGWQVTNAASAAAQQVLDKLQETNVLLSKAEKLDKQAQEILNGAKESVVRRYVIFSVDQLPETGQGNVQYLVQNGNSYDVFVWAQIGGLYAGWVKIGTEADITMLQASVTTSGAVRLAADMSDDSGVTTAKQVREYVQSGAGYVTVDALEPLARTEDMEERMEKLHEDVLTADNATQFVEISRAEFEALQAKPNNVYYLIYES